MAAFRGRSLLRGFVCAGSGGIVGCCASCSVTLIVARSACFGGLVSWNWGIALAIEVSGVPALRGGGGGSFTKECGIYEVVCIFRFVDARED